MRRYHTIDSIPDLTADEMSGAMKLAFASYSTNTTNWDYEATTSGIESNPISLYSFEAFEGATYDIFSVSFLDPILLRLFDQNGNAIEVNLEENDPEDFNLSGTSHGVDVLWDWVAPYTGTYYVWPSWNQGTINTFHSLQIYEDLDTISLEPLSAKAGRIFNWAEDEYSVLFSDHPETEIISGFNARIYSSGTALGEKNGDIYFYDGGPGGTDTVILVGSVSDFLPLALADGF